MRGTPPAPRGGGDTGGAGGSGQREESTGRRCPAAGGRAGRGSARPPRPCGGGVSARDRCGACAPRYGRRRPGTGWRASRGVVSLHGIKLSRSGSSGNNDERTAERSGRSGRVMQPGWNIVANAAIRTGPMKKVICRTNSGSLRMARKGVTMSAEKLTNVAGLRHSHTPSTVWATSRATADARAISQRSRTSWPVPGARRARCFGQLAPRSGSRPRSQFRFRCGSRSGSSLRALRFDP
jgi:hypothetical protein